MHNVSNKHHQTVLPLFKLVGEKIAKAWNVYGFTLFLEVGKLNKEDVGDYTFMSKGNWKIYQGETLFINGVDQEHATIDPKLTSISEKTIVSIEHSPDIEKSVICLTHHLSLVITRSTQGYWAIHFRKQGFWLIAAPNGDLEIEKADPQHK